MDNMPDSPMISIRIHFTLVMCLNSKVGVCSIHCIHSIYRRKKVEILISSQNQPTQLYMFLFTSSMLVIKICIVVMAYMRELFGPLVFQGALIDRCWFNLLFFNMKLFLEYFTCGASRSFSCARNECARVVLGILKDRNKVQTLKR